MTISTSSNTVTILGNIKSISDFQEIKTTFDSITTSHKSLTVNIKDSISITSSVIGYFNKLVLKDGIALQLKIGNDQLYTLIDDLNLVNALKATKV
jgi:hypothetical protein